MLYEIKNGFYKRCNHIHYLFIILISALILSISVNVGTSISANRRYRAQLERCAQLESIVREQEQDIRRTSEELRLQYSAIEQTNRELGDIIQSSNERISSSITTVQELRETMQNLENDYNSMRNRLIIINRDLSTNLYSEELEDEKY